MKELSVEEKAKRYDEALIRGSKLWESDMITRENYEYIFPEVKESENIKIIKAIKYGLDHVFTNNTTVFEVTKEQCLAWLEKQGEHANFRNKIQIGDKVTRNEDGVLVNLSQLNRVAKKQGEQKSYASETMNENGDFDNGFTRMMEKEQKPAWSKEDKKIWEEISDMLWEGYRQSCSKFTWDNIRDWIKPKIECFKDRTQPKQEWSEEDEYCRHQLIVFCENCMVKDEGAKKCAHWLKSLKPQNTWKPSEEQMAVLNEVINYAANSELQHWNNFIYTLLKSLREQLKKLREE